MNHCHAHTPQTPSRRRWTTYVAAPLARASPCYHRGYIYGITLPHTADYVFTKPPGSSRSGRTKVDHEGEVLCCTLSNACVCCVSQW